MQFGGSPKCPKCGKSVYFNERVRALGKDYHKTCFACENCKKVLSLGAQREHEEEIYCSPCYGRLFGPSGLRQGLIAETGLGKDGKPVDYRIKHDDKPSSSSEEATEASKRRSSNPVRKWGSNMARPSVTMPFVKGPGNSCPKCSKTVGFAEKISALGNTFHKDCFRCIGCKRTLNTSNFTDSKDESGEIIIYCKPCYQSAKGPKGYGYSGAVGHTT